MLLKGQKFVLMIVHYFLFMLSIPGRVQNTMCCLAVQPGGGGSTRGMKKKAAYFFLAYLFLLNILSGEANAGGREQEFQDEGPRVVILVLDRLMLDDLLAYSGPVLQSILEKSASGLMNVNTAGAPGTDSGYLSMGAGAKLTGNWAAGRAYNREEMLDDLQAAAVYRRHTGTENVPEGAIIHLYAESLSQLNEKRPYPFYIGIAGEALKAEGLNAAVLGNADIDGDGRHGVLLAMDAAGAVGFGDVSKALLRKDPEFPYGARSDAGKYSQIFGQVYEQSRLIVVDWGDTKRIDAYLPHLSLDRRGGLLEETLQELDLFLGEMMGYFTPETRMLIVTPSPPDSAASGGIRLVPVIFYNPGQQEPGILTSATTMRWGIVTSLDVVPTALSILELDAPAFLWGAPLAVEAAKEPLVALDEISRDTHRVFRQRTPIIRGYILAQIVLLSIGFCSLFSTHRFFARALYGLYALLGFPLAVLLAPAFPFFPARSLYLNTGFLLLTTLVIVVLSFRLFSRRLFRLCFLALLTFFALVADLLTGAALISHSFLGYDPIAGARFYGIGNEYMGVLVGAFLFGYLALVYGIKQERQGHFKEGEQFTSQGMFFPYKVNYYFWVLFCILGLLLIFLMASPQYGANFGGAITCGVAIGFVAAALYPRGCPFVLLPGKPGVKYGWIILLFIGGTGVFLYLLNVTLHGEAISHLGRTWELVQVGGWEELENVIRRKAETNLRLLRYSIWSRIFLFLVAVLTILTFYPAGLMKKIFGRHPFFRVALGGIIAGGITALLANDSGVVAAATTMLYGVVPLFLLEKD